MRNFKASNRVHPQELFNVSEQVNYLEASQAQQFEEAFLRWKSEAKRSDSVLARERIWLIFSLLRSTGARLGEVLSLDDTVAFDAQGSIVRLGRQGRMREIPISDELFLEIMTILESPMGCGLRGQFFHIDPGYFRRICYARGKECSLPKELACPKVLRNTRAVEMLRSGVPITVVKDILGQSSLNLTAAFQQFSQGDITSIVQKSLCKQTSARNSFVGHVIEVQSDAVMAEVLLETRFGLRICAVITMDSLRNLKIVKGSPVVATIKAPLVNVLMCKDLPIGSAQNRFKAKVLRVTDSPAISEVVGRLSDGTDVCALISAQSARGLALQTGDNVEFWFKALSVVLNIV